MMMMMMMKTASLVQHVEAREINEKNYNYKKPSCCKDSRSYCVRRVN